jgi:hypothetical protein
LVRAFIRLDQFDAVAERVAQFAAGHAGKRDIGLDGVAGGAEAVAKAGEVVYGVGEVGFRPGTVEAVLNADVDLQWANLEPEAATALEDSGLGDLLEAQQVDVEGASVGLPTGWDRDLDVVEAAD